MIELSYSFTLIIFDFHIYDNYVENQPRKVISIDHIVKLGFGDQVIEIDLAEKELNYKIYYNNNSQLLDRINKLTKYINEVND
jgi:hypothetical protein